MTDPKIRVLFLWHMHQPYYKDLVTGVYRLPWARLHALKDYYGMVAMLEEFPSIHQTFNLVPSLLLQLQDYASGTAREPMQEIAFTRASDLTPQDRLFILQYFFQANVEHLISRYPRYLQLYERMQANQFVAERALPFFRDNDFTDLQVLSQLAWFDELFLAHDPEIRALVSKGQGYNYEDQMVLQERQRQAIQKVLDAYKAAADRGQIEISTSPFYHPILPLLCDSNVAAEAYGGVRLPHLRFQHPEDARLQLERAIDLHRKIFGRSPHGLWPSEGSVSEEVLRISSSLGFRWAATDQQVLGNSIGTAFYRNNEGFMVNAERLYTSYAFSTPSGPIQMIFRDHELSDRIGFVYSRMEPEAAAADFCDHIQHSASPLLRQGRSPLISIILDGENAWEYYLENGRPFLRALYKRLSEDPQVECLTISEALERHGDPEPLARVAPGSWINANFDIWIGSEEDNQAWDYLSEARDFFAERQSTADPGKRALALEELLVAEGSDWCWWYGPEHSTANDVDFDALFRSHLSNVYQALNHRPPDTLAQPIKHLRQQVHSAPPIAAITPCIDGAVTNYFEWMGAGFYSPVQMASTMHGPSALMRELYFGRDAQNFFLRIDFYDTAGIAPGKDKLRIVFRNGGLRAILVTFAKSSIDRQVLCDTSWEEDTPWPRSISSQAALGKIFEMRISLQSLGLNSKDPFDFQVTLWEEFPRETFPLEGWITVPAPN